MNKLFTLGRAVGTTLVLVLGAASSMAGAELGRFTFSGVQYKTDPSNNLPASVAVDAPFTGTMSYDPTPDIEPGNSTYGYYTYNHSGGLRMSVTVGGHTFASMTPTNAGGDVLLIYNQLNGAIYDSTTFETVANLLDGASLPGVDYIYMDFYLADGSGTAFSTDAIPAPLPPLSQFSSHYWAVYGGLTGGGSFNIQGDITNITTILPPALSINTDLPNGKVRVSWPLIGTNYVLEQRATVTGTWSQVAFPYVTNGATINKSVGTNGNASFFRLRLP